MMLSCLTAYTFCAEASETKSAEVSASVSDSVGADYGLADDVQDGQILQCWNWSYNGIKANMAKIAEQGFSAVQTSPIQTIKETTQNRQMSGSWWVYYQPSNFSIDTSSQNALGTKSDFKAMCDEAHKYGVKVIVDAVLNHMANNGDNVLSPTIPDDIRNDSNCWHSITTNTSNWSSRWDITHNCMGGLPDLNTGNSKVQKYEKAFMKECIDAGADGFRFDGAKHIELPNDDENSSSDFWTEVLDYTTSYAQSSRGITPYYYGEILDKPAGGQSIVNGYTSLMSVTANKVSDDIRNQINSGNASGAKRSDFSYDDGSAPAANKAVLWNESHDTYANNSSRGQSDTTLKKTWAMVGSRAQACGMYLARPQNYSDQIGTASVTAWGDKEVQAINKFKNSYIGKSEYLASEGSIAYNERGTDGVVLINCNGSSATVSVTAHKMAEGLYTDQISGNTFEVTNGKINGLIGSTGIAVVYNAKPAGPSASVTPGSQTYKTDTLTLTLKYSNATSGQYSIDGGSYTSFTNGQTITIGSGLDYGTKTTVSVKASDGSQTSDAETYTYTKVDPNLVQKVYFDNSSYNWSDVYAYIYVDSSNENASWPGVKMTKDSATGYYVLEVPEELTNGYVIFTESKDATDNRYPGDGETGMALNGNTMIMKANHSWQEYTVVSTTAPATTVTATTVTATTAPATTAPATTTPTTTVSTTTEPTTTQPIKNVLIGDVNSDGTITIIDATELQLYINGNKALSDDALVAADVNMDGEVDINDATAIQYYIIEIYSSSAHCGEYTGETPTTEPVTESTTEPATEPTTVQANYLYYKNTNNWSTVMAYYWSSDNTKMTSWPGVDTTAVGNNTYRVEVPSEATMIIFNNGGNGSKTGDLTIEGYNKIYEDGSWNDYSSSEEETEPSTSSTDEDYVYYYNSNGWDSVNAYYWSSHNTKMTTWPGEAMESIGNNVYRIKCPSEATYIIFNNGSSKTGDLSLEGMNKIYKDGSWSDYTG